MKKLNYIDLGVHEGEEIDIVLQDYSDYQDDFDLTIYGVEANPNLFHFLVGKYKHFDNVKLFNNAITMESGLSRLYLGEGTLASSIYPTKNNVTNQSVSVIAYSFFDFVKNNILDFEDSFNVLKLNIEGAELAVYENLIEKNMVGDIDIFCGHHSHDIEKISELESKRERYYSLIKEYGLELEYLCGEDNPYKSINIFERYDEMMKTFKLDKNKDTICTLGSCFALEIRRELEDRNFKTSPVLGEWEERNEQLVWYNTFSILYEFERAFAGRKTNYDDLWKARRWNRWSGYQEPSRREVFHETLEGLIELSEKLDKEIIDGMRNANVYVCTLGLSEVFKHKKSGDVVCTHPAYNRTRGEGLRLVEFWNLTKEDNLKNLQRICTLVKENNPNAKVLFTVSPIPLQRTFTKTETDVANFLSKDKLHWAAKKVVEEFDNAHYFDSYEYVMNLPKDVAFESDGRHVTRDTVAEVISRFESKFL